MGPTSGRAAFTLIELVVVVAVVAVLLGILLPAVQKVREAAARARCGHHLRQLALAGHGYHDAHHRLPPGQVGPYTPAAGQPYYGWGPDSRGWSWLARLLPHVEQAAAHDRGRIPARTLRQSGVAHLVVRVFLCPSAGPDPLTRTDAGNLTGFEAAVTCYKGVSGANWGFSEWEGKPVDTDWANPSADGSSDGTDRPDGALFRSDVRRPLRLEHIPDGTSQTFLVGEDVPAMNRWATWAYANNAYGTCAIPPNARGPGGQPLDPDHWGNTWGFRSRHPGGLQFALADGSARFVRDATPLATYRALATIRAGEVVAADGW